MSKIIQQINFIKDNLSNDKQKIYYDFLLQNGVCFYKKDLLNTKSDFRRINPELKGCYKSAFKSSSSFKDCYMEGYYLFNDFPFIIEHAFNIRNNFLVDHVSLLHNKLPDEWFGINIPFDFVQKVILKNKYYDNVIREYIYYMVK